MRRGGLDGDGAALSETKGVATALHPIGDDPVGRSAGWPVTLEIGVDRAWPSGLYLARVSDRTGATIDVPFVVREDAPGSTSRILALRPDNTIAAYNVWGGGCLYPTGFGPARPVVSFERPLQMRAAWPKKWNDDCLAWIERSGFRLEYAGEIDLQRDPALLDDYDTLLLLGHHEYWSRAMRDAVDAFRGNGGTVIVLHGNVCYWQVRFEDGLRAIRCHKLPVADAYFRDDDPQHRALVTTVFAYPPVLDPPDRTFGLEFRHAEWTGTADHEWETPFSPLGSAIPEYPRSAGYGALRVEVADHPMFAGLGLARDAMFGAGTLEGQGHSARIVTATGECDGASLERVGDRLVASIATGAPGNLLILATAPAQEGFTAIATFEDGGVVIDAGVQGWPDVLGLPGDGLQDVVAATKNLLRIAQTPRRSLVRNGGFERWSDGRPIGFDVEGRVERSANAFTGRAALRMPPGSASSISFDVDWGEREAFITVAVQRVSGAASLRLLNDDGGAELATISLNRERVVWQLVKLRDQRVRVRIENGGDELVIDQLEVVARERFDAECRAAVSSPRPGGSKHLVLSNFGALFGRATLLDAGRVIASGPSGPGFTGFVASDFQSGRALHLSVEAPGALEAHVWPLRAASGVRHVEGEARFKELESDLFSNGDFEIAPCAAEIAAADWTHAPPHWVSEPAGRLAIDASVARHGTHSLRVGGEGATRAWSPVSEPLRTDRGWSLHLSVKTGDAPIEIEMLATPFGKAPARLLASKTVQPSADWQDVDLAVSRVQAEEFLPHAAAQGWIQVRVPSGTASVDAIVVLEDAQ